LNNNKKSWNWYKFGSSIICKATNLTPQLGLNKIKKNFFVFQLESVESSSSLGAIDPVKLARKTKMEHEKLSNEVKTEEEFNDNWDDDTNEELNSTDKSWPII
jgi:hypothetical protein